MSLESAQADEVPRDIAIEAAERAHCDLEDVTFHDVMELHREMQREHNATHPRDERFLV